MVCERPPRSLRSRLPLTRGTTLLELACKKIGNPPSHHRFVIHIRNQRSADIAIEIANFHCVPDERRWRIANPATILIQVRCYPREGRAAEGGRGSLTHH